MQTQTRHARRPAGTGSLFLSTDSAGRESWYGKFRIGGRQVKRRLGAKRLPGGTDGLSRPQAEKRLRELMGEVSASPPPDERLSFATAAERYVSHVENVRRRRATTVADYRSAVRRHLSPFFQGKRIDAIDPDLVESYMSAKTRDGLSVKTIGNHLTLLHGIFRFAHRKGWCRSNPVAAIDRPSQPGADPDIRFFDQEELEALVRAVPDDELGALEKLIYRTAAMTGLRQGELIALRWHDVDWLSGVVRVRRSYTRGEYHAPKSRRGSRSVPLARVLAAELERHFQSSAFRADHDLVFAHPLTGGPYDASKMRKRFKDALKRAGLRPLRFHDLRHTFGTRMAGAGVPMRTLQEWMGHRDYKTTSIYADYEPRPEHAALVDQAFTPVTAALDGENRESVSSNPEPLAQPLQPRAA
jgi:integrase